MKLCIQCKENKPMSEFYSHSGTQDKLRTQCKDCCRAYGRENYRKTSAQQRNSGLKTKYGITEKMFEILSQLQGDTCALCKNPPKLGQVLHVDHDHISGKVRGLLCQKCNTAIGAFGDSVENLKRAINYLENPTVPVEN